jgi:hypothetical protein
LAHPEPSETLVLQIQTQPPLIQGMLCDESAIIDLMDSHS